MNFLDCPGRKTSNTQRVSLACRDGTKSYNFTTVGTNSLDFTEGQSRTRLASALAPLPKK